MAVVTERPSVGDPTRLDGGLSTKPTPRVERLKQRYLDTKNKLVIDLLRIRTQVMKETEGQEKAVRQAKAFAAAVRQLPTNIYPDELLVGWMFSEPHGSPFMPSQAVMMEKELDTLDTREYMPFLIGDEAKQELREDIIPYLKAHLHYYGIESLTHWTGGYEKVFALRCSLARACQCLWFIRGSCFYILTPIRFLRWMPRMAQCCGGTSGKDCLIPPRRWGLPSMKTEYMRPRPSCMCAPVSTTW